MPAVWRSRYPAHISPSCSVTHQISIPLPPAAPALPWLCLSLPSVAQGSARPTELWDGEEGEEGEKGCSEAEAQPSQICIFFTGSQTRHFSGEVKASPAVPEGAVCWDSSRCAWRGRGPGTHRDPAPHARTSLLPQEKPFPWWFQNSRALMLLPWD